MSGMMVLDSQLLNISLECFTLSLSEVDLAESMVRASNFRVTFNAVVDLSSSTSGNRE